MEPLRGPRVPLGVREPQVKNRCIVFIQIICITYFGCPRNYQHSASEWKVRSIIKEFVVSAGHEILLEASGREAECLLHTHRGTWV